MFKYFIKKLGNQELGSVNSFGVAQRGRYIFVSKSPEILSIFPALSEIVVNDSALLPILVMYSGEKVYCNFIYHNDSISRPGVGTRNEYRIYLNKSLDSQDHLYYQAGDYVIIRKVEFSQDGVDNSFYALNYVEASDLSFATFIDSLSPIRANSGQYYYEGVITSFETKLQNTTFTGKAIVDEKVTAEIQKEEIAGRDISSLFTAQTFRDFVLAGYQYKCAITHKNIQYKELYNIEAAHIMPRSHLGLFMPNNGIALSRDMHWAFDKGFYTITDDLKVKVHPEIDSDYLREYDGQSIFLPANQFFIPDISNLRYHQENIYGLFKTTGRL